MKITTEKASVIIAVVTLIVTVVLAVYYTPVTQIFIQSPIITPTPTPITTSTPTPITTSTPIITPTTTPKSNRRNQISSPQLSGALWRRISKLVMKQ